MDWRLLATFVGVARCGSFAGFARQQALAPSSVSRSIAALEHELGARLFQRTTRKLTTTDAGQRLLLHVEPILEQLEDIRSVARGAAAEVAGMVRVTAPMAFGQTVLSPLFVEFARMHPEVALTVVLADEHLDLVAERIDVALRLGKLASSTFVAHRLGRLVHVACASPRYLERRGTPRRPEELAQHDCLHFPLRGVRAEWHFRADGRAPVTVPVHGPVAINSGSVLRDCARDGLGVTLVPRWNVEHDLEEGKLVELFPSYDASASDLDASAWLLQPSRAHVPARVRMLVDFLRPRLQRHSSLASRRARSSRR